MLGPQRLSGILSQVVYILILIPVLIAALDAITYPASNMPTVNLKAIPPISAVGLLVALAYVVGRVVSGLITNLLRGVGFDAPPARVGIGKVAAGEKRMPSAIVGYLVVVTIMLLATIEASRLLGFETVGDLVAWVMVFAGLAFKATSASAMTEAASFASLLAAVCFATPFMSPGCAVFPPHTERKTPGMYTKTIGSRRG